MGSIPITRCSNFVVSRRSLVVSGDCDRGVKDLNPPFGAEDKHSEFFARKSTKNTGKRTSGNQGIRKEDIRKTGYQEGGYQGSRGQGRRAKDEG